MILGLLRARIDCIEIIIKALEEDLDTIQTKLDEHRNDLAEKLRTLNQHEIQEIADAKLAHARNTNGVSDTTGQLKH